MIRVFEILIKMGVYPSRSEGIRAAIRDFLIKAILGNPEHEEWNNPKYQTKYQTRQVRLLDQKKEIMELLKKIKEENIPCKS